MINLYLFVTCWCSNWGSKLVNHTFCLRTILCKQWSNKYSDHRSLSSRIVNGIFFFLLFFLPAIFNGLSHSLPLRFFFQYVLFSLFYTLRSIDQIEDHLLSCTCVYIYSHPIVFTMPNLLDADNEINETRDHENASLVISFFLLFYFFFSLIALTLKTSTENILHPTWQQPVFPLESEWLNEW